MTNLELARVLLNLPRGPHLRRRVLAERDRLANTVSLVDSLVPATDAEKADAEARNQANLDHVRDQWENTP